MSYTTTDYKTKKALKGAIKIGEVVRCYNPGIGPNLSNYTGTIYLEGPHYPKPHTWYAKAELKNGVIVKVT